MSDQDNVTPTGINGSHAMAGFRPSKEPCASDSSVAIVAIALRRLRLSCISRLGGFSEQPLNEQLLPEHITFRQPADLTLSNNVHCFLSRNRA